MTFGYKDTEAALHAYTSALSGLKVSQSFFTQLNFEYVKLLIALFKRLIETNSLNRMDEFLKDFCMFCDDMLRKYGTTSPYGYSPRSPYEKRMGIESKQRLGQSNILTNHEIKHYYENNDEYSC